VSDRPEQAVDAEPKECSRRPRGAQRQDRRGAGGRSEHGFEGQVVHIRIAADDTRRPKQDDCTCQIQTKTHSLLAEATDLGSEPALRGRGPSSNEEIPMIWYHREPTLEEILSDPLTRAVMEADGVDRHQLEAMLRQAGRNLPPLRGGGRWGPRSTSRGQPRHRSCAALP